LRKRQLQKRTKLPTAYKRIKECGNCHAAMIHSYDWFNGVYKIKCQNCGSTRYDPDLRFKVRFQTAVEIGIAK
jgi:transcription elongation factor Elf1